MEWRRAGLADNRWPRCVVGSGVLHLVLLVACVLFQPVSDNPRSMLRVRLLERATASEPAAIVKDSGRRPAPTRVAAPPRPRSRRPLPQAAPAVPEPPPAAPPRLEPVSPPPAAPAHVDEAPLAPSPSFPSAEAEPPAPGAAASAVVEQSGPPAEPLATGASTGAPGSQGSRDDASLAAAGGRFGSSAPTVVSDAEPRGAFLLDARRGDPGVGNGSGPGRGDRLGPGPGGGAEGATGGGDGQAGGSAPLARGGSGAGSGGRNGEQLLRTIRRQIERVWTYPDAARRDGLEGTVWLRFRIAPDGSVEHVEVDRSSGHTLLDDAAVSAVRRASPYPPYGGPIRYPFTYRLDR